MKYIEERIHKLILREGFKYFPEDKYFIRRILRSENKSVRVLDVGCGNGHYSFLFEKCGANVIAFDYDQSLIEKANEKKKEINSNAKFLIADGRYPERYFTDKFDFLFLCGFSLFGIDMNKEVMKKYLSLLDRGGKLVFVHSSNLTGTVRKTNWRNHEIDELQLFFEELDCRIQEFFFYDRHISMKLLHSFAFNKVSTKIHILVSKMTTLPCNLVFVVIKN